MSCQTVKNTLNCSAFSGRKKKKEEKSQKLSTFSKSGYCLSVPEEVTKDEANVLCFKLSFSLFHLLLLFTYYYDFRILH